MLLSNKNNDEKEVINTKPLKNIKVASMDNLTIEVLV